MDTRCTLSDGAHNKIRDGNPRHIKKREEGSKIEVLEIKCRLCRKITAAENIITVKYEYSYIIQQQRSIYFRPDRHICQRVTTLLCVIKIPAHQEKYPNRNNSIP